MSQTSQIFTFLFLMLGPFKILAPFAKITRGADQKLTRQIAFRAIVFSSVALLLAAVIGENMLNKFGIPLPILSLAGGLILFLVALLNIIQQFAPPATNEGPVAPPTLNMAINPLAFPTIVTPYGIAAVIVFLSISPDLNSKLTVGAIILGIMIINLIFMLIYRYIFKVLAVALPILGAILGVVQVALGLMIMYNSLRKLLPES
jgi:multiple antibiotic resistance protein